MKMILLSWNDVHDYIVAVKPLDRRQRIQADWSASKDPTSTSHLFPQSCILTIVTDGDRP